MIRESIQSDSVGELRRCDTDFNCDERKPVVEMRALTKSYEDESGTRSVIERADCVIYQGEFVALSGPSGSGKTTILNLVSGIDTPTSGEVLIDSTPITKLSETERTLFRRRNIGFVFQFFNSDSDTERQGELAAAAAIERLFGRGIPGQGH